VLDPPAGHLPVLEHRPAGEGDANQGDSSRAEKLEFDRLGGRRVEADEGAHPQAEAGEGEGPVGDPASQPPTPRIATIHVAGGGPNDDDRWRSPL
jgi:hypothetical protein